MGQTPTTRSATFYRLTLAAPVAAGLYIAASGRLTAYVTFFRSAFSGSHQPSEAEFSSAFVTDCIWLLSLVPFLFASWELGRQHVRAWRGGTELLTGMASVLRIAFRGQLSSDQAKAFSRAPSDRPAVAALWGIGIGSMIPVFFLTAAAELRHPPGVLWLSGAGLLAGAGEFFRRRAMAYVRDERRGFFAPYWIGPGRCEPAGKRFAVAHLIALFALPVWWVLGGFLVLH
jgi:hypothetical protein